MTSSLKTSATKTENVIKGKIIKGKYFDSVSLMRLSKIINEEQGICDSSVVMGTAENRAILKAAHLFTDEFETSSDNDLLIAVKGDSEKSALSIIDHIDDFLALLKPKTSSLTDGGCGRGENQARPKSLAKAKELLPSANLAMISIAGKYAGIEAMQALKMGMHVMLFSDNISIEEELELKTYAEKEGLLVMGPDCGTAIIHGVPLAFANVVKRGNIGVVAASGTGLQEVTTLISNAGGGISQAIGTGGRDIKKEIGGITFLQAMRILAEDPQTEVILLIAKPPHETVLKKIVDEIKISGKPTVTLFLGAKESDTLTLAEAAEKALELADIYSFTKSFDLNDLEPRAKKLKKSLHPNQKYIRALFSGGTFASETQIIWSHRFDLKDDELYSNVPIASGKKLNDCHTSKKHTVLDLGDDDFTVGRPHPMIDFSTRVRRIREESKCAETAIILLDIVLGYGSHMDPLNEIVPVIKEVKAESPHIIFIASVTGTEEDPQVRSKVASGLKAVGVEMTRSNAEASYLAGLCVMQMATMNGEKK